jgi:hypothetical protein
MRALAVDAKILQFDGKVSPACCGDLTPQISQLPWGSDFGRLAGRRSDFLRTVFVAMLVGASAFGLVACSKGSADGSSAEAAQAQPVDDDGAMPDPKTFAKRYNALAIDSLKIQDLAASTFSRNEHYVMMHLAGPHTDSIGFRVEKASYNYSNTQQWLVGVENIKKVCSWMARAVRPNLSEQDAEAMASQVVDTDKKVIVGDLIMGWPGNDHSGCDIRLTGL